jgi:hypothetical protein
MAHGAEFSWKGLGYFGIGAAVGAIGAGVGVGIQTASAGAAFGAGFVGSSQGISTIISVGYTSSFVTGAAVGAGAGFAGGFTTGFGNGLMQGQNFGLAMWSGAKDGIMGGAIGGLSGGIAGGIDAVRDNRNFWNGDPWTVTHDYRLPRTWTSPSGDLPIHNQPDQTVGCTQNTLESFSDYRMQNFEIPDDGGADLKQLAHDWGYEMKENYNNVHRVGSEMLKGNPSGITYNNGGVQHTVGINRIQVMSTTKLFGNGYRYKNIINVMDPLVKNYYPRLSNSIFNSGVIRTLGFYHGFVRAY